MDTSQQQPIKNERLKNRRVFSERQLILGVPNKLFIGVLGIAISMFLVISMVAGLMFGIIILTTLYIIHKDDPDAFDFYISSLTRPSSYAVGEIEPLKVKLVKEHFDDSISVRSQLPTPRSKS